MPILFDLLYFAEPTPIARRLLWHVLSIGSVRRDEPERHPGSDKAGLFFFQVVSGKGVLQLEGRDYGLERGDRCWLVDLRQPRSYLPSDGKMFHTQGVRFSGPASEAWLETLGENPVFELPHGVVRLHLRRLRSLIQRRARSYEWKVHLELTALLGQLLSARSVFAAPKVPVPDPVARVLDAVYQHPTRDWRARELARLAGISYSRLRGQFQQARGQTLHAFLQETRLDMARLLLTDGRLSIKQVANRLSFSSEFYFSHFFHRKTGMSPTEFRQRCRA